MDRFIWVLLLAVIAATLVTHHYVVGIVATAALIATYDLATLATALRQPPD
jgi:hypothetical protein